MEKEEGGICLKKRHFRQIQVFCQLLQVEIALKYPTDQEIHIAKQRVSASPREEPVIHRGQLSTERSAAPQPGLSRRHWDYF